MVGNAVMFVLFAILLQPALSHKSKPIRCLECNSYNNSMCIDPLKYDRDTIIKYIPIVQCGRGQFFCRKVMQTMLHGSSTEGRVRVTRGCGWARSKDTCYTVNSRDNNMHIEICQCFKDYCNGAAAHALFLSLMVAAIVFHVLV